MHMQTAQSVNAGHSVRGAFLVTPAEWTQSRQESSLAATDNHHNDCKGRDMQKLWQKKKKKNRPQASFKE